MMPKDTLPWSACLGLDVEVRTLEVTLSPSAWLSSFVIELHLPV